MLIGHSHAIAEEAPHYAHDDVEHGLWYVRNGETKWANREPLTESDRTNLYAGEVFLRLGQLTGARYCGQEIEQVQNDNPFKTTTLEVIDSISPFSDDEVLLAPITIQWPNLEPGKHGLPALFDEALDSQPSVADELTEKWAKARAIHAKRGTVAMMAYNVDELIQGLRGLNVDEVAPDAVEFDEDANVVSEEHNLGGLVERTGLKAHLAEVPYYSTFSERKNAAEMLSKALEDLKLVSQAIATTS